jgi:hypothetical protein
MSALEVNECRVSATGSGVEWWNAYRSVFCNTDRVTVIKSTLGGEVVSVKCDDLEHANWLYDLAIIKGIPKSALKVRAA